MKMSSYDRRNTICFGLGTIGRDMFYTVVSTCLIVYLTEALDLPDKTMWGITLVWTILRVFDAVNDPIVGVIVDNTKSRFGKFKPWITIGAVSGAVFMVLMFVDFGLTGAAFVAVFGFCYLAWDMTYGANDIAYWSMMPTLSMDQKVREKIGSFARICANIGLFAVIVGYVPVTNALGEAFGSAQKGWFVFALAVAVFMIAVQMITVFGVRESNISFKQEEKTSLREMFRILFKNDQLLIVAVAMGLFMVGYCATTGFGFYFFKYAYRDENMYSVFAAVLGVSQLAALAVFPLLSKRFSRRQLYTFSSVLVLAGYLLFFFAPMNMLPIGIAGVLMFVGQAFIQLMMYMFLADTVEYGQWKLGKRSESVTFSVMPFINKIGGALGNGIVSATLIISGINAAKTASDVTPQGLLIMKISMMILPLILIITSYIIYRLKYKIDAQYYERIVGELEARGDIEINSQN